MSLQQSAACGDVDRVRRLILAGADIDAFGDLYEIQKTTALIAATHQGRFNTIRCLLQHGACLNIGDDGG